MEFGDFLLGISQRVAQIVITLVYELPDRSSEVSNVVYLAFQAIATKFLSSELVLNRAVIVQNVLNGLSAIVEIIDKRPKRASIDRMEEVHPATWKRGRRTHYSYNQR